MGNMVVFGSYVPLNSPIHRLDARTKLILCIWYVISVFFANHLWPAIWISFVLLITLIISRVPLRMYWTGIKPFLIVILITVCLQVLFSSGGQMYWHYGWISITSDGIKNAFLIFYRFTVIITASTILTVTTATLQLAGAFSWLIFPLKWLRVPVDKISLMLSIALRFVPTIMADIKIIMNAQRSRGMDFHQGNLITRLKHLIPIIIPLFVNSFQHSEDLATAMEARGYSLERPRTQYRQLSWHKGDTVALLLMLMADVVIGILNLI